MAACKVKGDIQPVSVGAPVPNIEGKLTVRLETGKESALAIGAYPTFKYNATGGGGLSEAIIQLPQLRLVFDPAGVETPAVTWRTARLLGVPLPPCFRIKIIAKRLEGTVDLGSGEFQLTFHAEFLFSAAGIYRAPPMKVETLLTSAEVQSKHHHKRGKRLDEDGCSVLVGVATVAKTGHWLLDWFLRLPTDVLGVMAVSLKWHLDEEQQEVQPATVDESACHN